MKGMRDELFHLITHWEEADWQRILQIFHKIVTTATRVWNFIGQAKYQERETSIPDGIPAEVLIAPSPVNNAGAATIVWKMRLDYQKCSVLHCILQFYTIVCTLHFICNYWWKPWHDTESSIILHYSHKCFKKL